MKNTKTDKPGILLLGIGNSGRNDDGLGWQFTDMVNNNCPGIDIDYRYQLQVEDALLVSNYDFVLFADASHTELPEGYEIKICLPSGHYFFSSHTQSPETILYLADELYQKKARAFTIAISGYNWGLGTTLSKEAAANLQNAVHYFIHDFLPSLQHLDILPADPDRVLITE